MDHSWFYHNRCDELRDGTEAGIFGDVPFLICRKLRSGFRHVAGFQSLVFHRIQSYTVASIRRRASWDCFRRKARYSHSSDYVSRALFFCSADATVRPFEVHRSHPRNDLFLRQDYAFEFDPHAVALEPRSTFGLHSFSPDALLSVCMTVFLFSIERGVHGNKDGDSPDSLYLEISQMIFRTIRKLQLPCAFSQKGASQAGGQHLLSGKRLPAWET